MRYVNVAKWINFNTVAISFCDITHFEWIAYTSDMKPKILVILGTTREGRRGEKVAKWAMNILSKRPDADFEFVDLRDWNFPFYNFSGYPSTEKGVYFSKLQEKWAKKVDPVDGFLIITPEYNHGYPGVLKNALDFLWYEWNHKPVTFISYGGMSGGVRVAEQLRQVSIEIEMIPIRNQVIIHHIKDAFDDKGKVRDEKLNKQLNGTSDALVKWANSLKKIRGELAY